MQINISMQGLEKVQKHLDSLSGPKAREALALGLNDTAFNVRRVMQNEIRSVFDRPTSYITRSPWITQATPAKITAKIAPTYRRDSAQGTGGKEGVDPQKILKAQAEGGQREFKKSEKALNKAGFLPNGMYTAIPADKYGGPYPGSTDGNGNIKGAFMSMLLSYLQASPEQGFKQNMSARRIAKMADRTTYSDLKSRKTLSLTRGVEFFVSYGQQKAGPKGRYSHLPPGIWARSGTHGSNLRAVLIFTKKPRYKRLLGMDGIAQKANTSEYMARRLRYRIRQAAGV